MGKKSIRENKNIYQTSREAAGLSREAAGEALQFVSPERIEKVESGKSLPHPDEVLAMETGYNSPGLCNWFCTHECPIGMKYIPSAELKDLSQVTIDILASLNALEEDKNKLIAIAVDGRVNDFERKDFDQIWEKLDSIDRAVAQMRIWVEHAQANGKMDEAE